MVTSMYASEGPGSNCVCNQCRLSTSFHSVGAAPPWHYFDPSLGVILIESDICGRRTGCSRTKEDVDYHVDSLQIFNINFQHHDVCPRSLLLNTEGANGDAGNRWVGRSRGSIIALPPVTH
jgi:hypothetical protein